MLVRGIACGMFHESVGWNVRAEIARGDEILNTVSRAISADDAAETMPGSGLFD